MKSYWLVMTLVVSGVTSQAVAQSRGYTVQCRGTSCFTVPYNRMAPPLDGGRLIGQPACISGGLQLSQPVVTYQAAPVLVQSAPLLYQSAPVVLQSAPPMTVPVATAAPTITLQQPAPTLSSLPLANGTACGSGFAAPIYGASQPVGYRAFAIGGASRVLTFGTRGLSTRRIRARFSTRSRPR